MKKISQSITALILLFCFTNLKAQDAPALTKNDAIYFINKVYQNFAKKWNERGFNIMSGLIDYGTQQF